MRIGSSLAPSTNPSERAQYQQQLRKLERRREELLRKLNAAAKGGGIEFT
ncbi:MAG: hypothetical protein LUG50_10265 [Planctomycetaceae bacterium]|nr:hypothetical protein [Planctomycetaceae bacterium]